MNTVCYKSLPFHPPSVLVLPPFKMTYDHWLRIAASYDIQVREEGFSTANAYFRDSTIHAYSRDILMCSGLLTSPAESLTDFTAWGACFQYATALRPSSGHLRLATDTRSWDNRKKGLLAESLSTGLAGYAMWFHDDIVHIADAGPFIGRSLPGPYAGTSHLSLRSLNLYGKNGGYKPDLFCLTVAGECVIAEIKGGIGAPSCLASEIVKGKEQVQNVKPVGINMRSARNRLVFATNFRYEDDSVRQGKDTCLSVVDPDENEMPLNVSLNADEIILSSYANLLRLSYRHDILTAMSASEDAIYEKDQIKRFGVLLNNWPIFPLYGDDHTLVGLDMDTAVALFALPRRGVWERLSEALGPYRRKCFSEQDHRHSLWLPNGIVIARNVIDGKRAIV